MSQRDDDDVVLPEGFVTEEESQNLSAYSGLSKLLQKHFDDYEGDGIAGGKASFHDRELAFRMGNADGGRQYVNVDFNFGKQSGKSTSYQAQNEEADSSSFALARKLKTLAKSLKSEGYGIRAQGSDQARDEAYDKMLTHKNVGMKQEGKHLYFRSGGAVPHFDDGGSPSQTPAKEKIDPNIVYSNDEGRIIANALHPETYEKMGYADFRKIGSDELYPNMVYTDEKFRRQGVATSVYKHMEDEGYSIRRSDALLPDGKKFRDKFDADPERKQPSFFSKHAGKIGGAALGAIAGGGIGAALSAGIGLDPNIAAAMTGVMGGAASLFGAFEGNELYKMFRERSHFDKGGQAGQGTPEGFYFNRIGESKGIYADASNEEMEGVHLYQNTPVFWKMQNYLRGTGEKANWLSKAWHNSTTGSQVRRAVAGVDSLQQRSSLPEMTVHRAMVIPEAGENNKQIEQLPGKTITDDGFVSTSKNPKAIENFMVDADRVRGEIRIPEGSKGINLHPNETGLKTKWDKEEEVMLPRGSQFQVESVQQDPDHRWRVKMDLLSKGNADQEDQEDDEPHFAKGGKTPAAPKSTWEKVKDTITGSSLFKKAKKAAQIGGAALSIGMAAMGGVPDASTFGHHASDHGRQTHQENITAEWARKRQKENEDHEQDLAEEGAQGGPPRFRDGGSVPHYGGGGSLDEFLTVGNTAAKVAGSSGLAKPGKLASTGFSIAKFLTKVPGVDPMALAMSALSMFGGDESGFKKAEMPKPNAVAESTVNMFGRLRPRELDEREGSRPNSGQVSGPPEFRHGGEVQHFDTGGDTPSETKKKPDSLLGREKTISEGPHPSSILGRERVPDAVEINHKTEPEKTPSTPHQEVKYTDMDHSAPDWEQKREEYIDGLPEATAAPSHHIGKPPPTLDEHLERWPEFQQPSTDSPSHVGTAPSQHTGKSTDSPAHHVGKPPPTFDEHIEQWPALEQLNSAYKPFPWAIPIPEVTAAPEPNQRQHMNRQDWQQGIDTASGIWDKMPKGGGLLDSMKWSAHPELHAAIYGRPPSREPERKDSNPFKKMSGVMKAVGPLSRTLQLADKGINFNERDMQAIMGMSSAMHKADGGNVPVSAEPPKEGETPIRTTPGEFYVAPEQASRFKPVLEAINDGKLGKPRHSSAPSSPAAMSGGGEIPQFPGVGSDEDEVPMNVRPNSFIVKKSETEKFKPQLQQIAKGEEPKFANGGTVNHFKDGGEQKQNSDKQSRDMMLNVASMAFPEAAPFIKIAQSSGILDDAGSGGLFGGIGGIANLLSGGGGLNQSMREFGGMGSQGGNAPGSGQNADIADLCKVIKELIETLKTGKEKEGGIGGPSMGARAEKGRSMPDAVNLMDLFRMSATLATSASR